jgi:iron complex outermembrane receptor protein
MNKKTIILLSLFCSQVLLHGEKLEEVYVTEKQESYFENYSTSSTKSEKSDNKTPSSIIVTKENLINDIQAQRIEDTYDYTTGVTKVGKNADAIMIRGFETSLENLKVNGMSGSISRMGSPSSSNVEKIEIVKGPSSVLYGSMEPGGMVNIITKKPYGVESYSFETSFQTYMSGVSSFGEDNGIRTSFDANIPLSENLYYRFIAAYENLNSYRDNVDFQNLYIYPSLLWNVNDETSLLVSMEYGKEDGSADDGLAVINHDISTAASINTVYQEESDFDNDEGFSLDLSLDHFFNDNLYSKFSWRSVIHNDERKLYEQTSVNSIAQTIKRRNRHQYNERDWHSFDATLNYDTKVLGLENSLLSGISGTYRKTDYDRIIQGSSNNVSPDISIYNPVLGGTASSNSGNRRLTEYYSSGIYLQDSLSLNENLTLVGATRFDRTKIDFICKSGSCNDDSTRYSSNITGSLGLIYNLNNIVSFYGNIAQSYNPISAERFDINGQGLETEKSNQIELGTKLNFSENLNSHFAIYKILKENVSEKVSGQSYYETIGEIESKGFETELQWLPTENWQLSLGYAYNKAEYTTGSSIGNQPKSTPKNTAQLFTRYIFPTKVYNGTLGVTSGVVFRDSIYTSSSENTRVKLPSYTRYDLGLSYIKKDWEFNLNIENLTDKVYYESGTNDYKIFSGEPRKLTLSVKKSF